MLVGHNVGVIPRGSQALRSPLWGRGWDAKQGCGTGELLAGCSWHKKWYPVKHKGKRQQKERAWDGTTPLEGPGECKGVPLSPHLPIPRQKGGLKSSPAASPLPNGIAWVKQHHLCASTPTHVSPSCQALPHIQPGGSWDWVGKDQLHPTPRHPPGHPFAITAHQAAAPCKAQHLSGQAAARPARIAPHLPSQRGE